MSAGSAGREVAEVAGLVLAAGAGRRMGRPKALLADARGEPLLRNAVEALREAGCAPVVVVLGAAADEAATMVPAGTDVVVATDWAEGLGASLRTGLERLLGPAELTARTSTSDGSAGVLVTLVDLPDVGAPVVRRVLEAWESEGAASDALVRATYAGKPGHPVLLGRDHWEPLRLTLTGDEGARSYLAGRRVREVSCDDLATGRDLDRPEDVG